MRLGVFAFAIITFLLTACGASAQQKALHATFLGVKAAEAGFVEWDDQQQKKIVEQAQTYESGERLLELHRRQREPVLQGFIAVYQLLYVAATDTTEAKVNAAISAAKKLYELIDSIKHPPPLRPTEARIVRLRKQRVLPAPEARWPSFDDVSSASMMPWTPARSPSSMCRMGGVL